jgi:hypothetical protein
MTIRFPMPAAFGDPAFIKCLHEAIETTELVESFDRLYGATLLSRKTPIARAVDEATGKTRDDMTACSRFVHEGIYMCLPDEAIDSLRASALMAQEMEAVHA